MTVKGGEHAIAETRIIGPADGAQPMLDITSGLGLIERAEMVGGDDTLTQLVELLARQRLAKLRLTEEEALQRGAAGDLQVRQHGQFLESGDRQGLTVVDEQQ